MIEAAEKWTIKLPGKETGKTFISCLDFNFDGTELAVCVGKRIFIYRSNDGKLVRQLRGHKDQVHSLSFGRNAKRLASGGADNCTIIWGEDGKGILKFSHSESVQVVLYNPIHDLLASCSCLDFGFWSPKEKSVVKQKVESKILSASWTCDGQILAIGLFSGDILLRDIHSRKRGTIRCSASVWTLAWRVESIVIDEPQNILCVGCWDKCVSFFSGNGEEIHSNVVDDFIPCTLTIFGGDDEFMLLGGSSKKVYLYSRGGIRLCCVSRLDDWVWSSKANTQQQIIASVDNNGTLSMNKIHVPDVFDRTFGRFAKRKDCTDIQIYDFEFETSTVIKCSDLVEKISLSANALAVGLHSKVVHIYSADIHSENFVYGFTHSIDVKERYDHLQVLSDGIIICFDHRIILYDFDGYVLNQWETKGTVTCIRVFCSFPGEESVLVGLKNGIVLSISLDNIFAVEIFSQSRSVAHLEISHSLKYIASLDEKGQLNIFDRSQDEVCQKIAGPVRSFMFHSEVESLAVYNNKGLVTTLDLAGTSASHAHQTEKEAIIQFRGCQVFFSDSTDSIDIALPSMISQHVDKKEFAAAYNLANLGISDSLWKFLGKSALLDSQYITAYKCFHRLREPPQSELLEQKISNDFSDTISDQEKARIIASIEVLDRNYKEAADIYVKVGLKKEAIDMFVKLCNFEEAKSLIGDTETADEMHYIVQKEADWETAIGNWKIAAEKYLECNEKRKAIEVVGEHKGDDWIRILVEMSNQFEASDADALTLCSIYLQTEGQYEQVKDIYKKIEDYNSLLKLCVTNKNWLEVSNICRNYEHEIDPIMMLPYAEWLCMRGEINDALNFYRKAGCHDKSKTLLYDLIERDILQKKYKSISEYYIMLEREITLNGVELNKQRQERDKCVHLSRSFFAFHCIYSYQFNSLTGIKSDTVLNACAFLANSIDMKDPPRGISMLQTYLILAKVARDIGDFQSSRFAYNYLRDMNIPSLMYDQVSLDMITIETTDISGKQDLNPICFRCGATNMLLRKTNTDSCSSCGYPFIRCFHTFEILPLVEFVTEKSILMEEAICMIQECSDSFHPSPPNSNTMPFDRALDMALTESITSYVPIEVDEVALRSLNREEVFLIASTTQPATVRLFKNMTPEIGLAVCSGCQQFFYEEDFEYEYLKNEGCPFCGHNVEGNYGHI